ncbi:hypothetical protein L6452_40183 [Arctium lappa]|uniref:Uncharacterized protein n=1 Tax=Arctium lappa TaxID=4217 RepID=A0ACB8XL84_ARCLA|nr:hypothetical protein L6452_40183 [Arctium lappa]
MDNDKEIVGNCIGGAGLEQFDDNVAPGNMLLLKTKKFLHSKKTLERSVKNIRTSLNMDMETVPDHPEQSRATAHREFVCKGQTPSRIPAHRSPKRKLKRVPAAVDGHQYNLGHIFIQ